MKLSREGHNTETGAYHFTVEGVKFAVFCSAIPKTVDQGECCVILLHPETRMELSTIKCAHLVALGQISEDGVTSAGKTIQFLGANRIETIRKVFQEQVEEDELVQHCLKDFVAFATGKPSTLEVTDNVMLNFFRVSNGTENGH